MRSQKQTTEAQLFEEAKRRFPIGIIFNNENLVAPLGGTAISAGNWILLGQVAGRGLEDIHITVETQKTDANGRFTIYLGGKWAKVILPLTDNQVQNINNLIDELLK